MHLTTEAAISAVAITVGLGPLNENHPIREWKEGKGFGMVELYSAIADLGTLSADLSDKVGNCVEFHHDGFPGVYAYEVDEELGGELVNLIGGTYDSLTGPKVKAKLGELALAYFKQVDKPIPITREIIRVMTGYTEPTPALTGIIDYDNKQALSEGWELFDVDGRLQLQRIDDPSADEDLGYTEPKFDSDAQAIIHVAAQASAGSTYHLHALNLIGTLAE